MTTTKAYDDLVERFRSGRVFIPVRADTGPAMIPSDPGQITEHPKRKGGWPKGKKRGPKAGK